ncbi:hypothetical protein [uncultured Brevundimonas sp.]|uniref:hypothetical protein n=1 Tax=uncultured Brevundimonas sp. TaxID=213418 RepID=UPI00259968AB|nr:hypothetical protein [uncultured Brevundimonas sp.]
MKLIAAIVVAGLVGFANPASACRWIGNHRALVHSAAPLMLPAGAIALDVEIEPEDDDSLYLNGLTARVRRVVAGDFDRAIVTLRLKARGSCDHPFENGSAGLIVGFLMPDETLAPLLVQQQSNYQLQSSGRAAAP